MQKLLILGTALIAAGMLAHGPAAAENIKLSLSGHFNAAVMVIDQDLDVNTRNHAFDREAEIFFRGSTILDNGLTVGVNVELEAESIDDQIDETYLYFKGGFGEIRLGQDDGAMQAMGIYPASAGHSMYGVLFPSHTYVAGGSLLARVRSVSAPITTPRRSPGIHPGSAASRSAFPILPMPEKQREAAPQ